MKSLANRTLWLDDMGHPIQAHGGIITRFGDTWYWYGENKGAPNCPGTTRVDVIGVSCYSSQDLLSWHHEGLVLTADENAGSRLHPSQVLERPKVVYVSGTGKYVMWFHSDTPDYTMAQAGCAVADSPVGPFCFQRILSPNRLDCRDMTLFTDQEGKHWLIHSGNWNKTLFFSRLAEDGMSFTGEYHAAMIDQEREAPAIFFEDGSYYCITSGCTGWKPNSALYAVSQHITCGWKIIDDPCDGPDARSTFMGQPACVFAWENKHYLLLDHWIPDDLQRSGYSILPITIENGDMRIAWQDQWDGIQA